MEREKQILVGWIWKGFYIFKKQRQASIEFYEWRRENEVRDKERQRKGYVESRGIDERGGSFGEEAKSPV